MYKEVVDLPIVNVYNMKHDVSLYRTTMICKPLDATKAKSRG